MTLAIGLEATCPRPQMDVMTIVSARSVTRPSFCRPSATLDASQREPTGPCTDCDSEGAGPHDDSVRGRGPPALMVVSPRVATALAPLGEGPPRAGLRAGFDQVPEFPNQKRAHDPIALAL